MVKSPRAIDIINCIHGVINDMIRTQHLDNHDFEYVDPRVGILSNINWQIHSLYHTSLNTTPRKLVSGQDVLFEMRFAPDWGRINQQKFKQVLKDNERENSNRKDHTYKIGEKIMIKIDNLRILRKSEFLNIGPYMNQTYA